MEVRIFEPSENESDICNVQPLNIIHLQDLTMPRQKTILGLSVSLLLALTTLDAGSAPISPDDFGPNKMVETFDSIAGLTGQPATPFVINDLTFETEGGTVRVFTPASGGAIECLGGAGSCLGTGTFDLESMDILLASPVTRAGVWVGLWQETGAFITSADVFFYDESDNLLGTVSVGGPRMNFAGWETNSALIARIRVTDTASNNRVIAVDDVTTEIAIPETVPIDIKPSSDPNSWPCEKVNDTLPVAILSDDTFDATSIDADSVLFGVTGMEATEVHKDNNGYAKRHVEDVDKDGRLDMVFHFRFGDTGFSCDDIPAGKHAALLPAFLTGETADGTLIEGEDSLRLVRK